MRKLEWFPLYAQEFLSDADVNLLGNEEVGGLIRLMCHDWVESGLRYNNDDLFKLGRFKERSTGVQRIMDKFVKIGDARTHPRLDTVRKEQRDKSKKCSIAGKKSAQKRRNGR